MASSAPILPQALLVASATALGYAPELWPFGEITGTALIVSARAEEKPRYVSACLHLMFVCLAHNTHVFVYVARTRLPGRATRYFTPLPHEVDGLLDPCPGTFRPASETVPVM